MVIGLNIVIIVLLCDTYMVTVIGLIPLLNNIIGTYTTINRTNTTTTTNRHMIICMGFDYNSTNYDLTQALDFHPSGKVCYITHQGLLRNYTR